MKLLSSWIYQIPRQQSIKNLKIFEKDLEDPFQVLRKVDIFGLVFEMRSPTNEELW
jgi:hypothetical protein